MGNVATHAYVEDEDDDQSDIVFYDAEDLQEPKTTHISEGRVCEDERRLMRSYEPEASRAEVQRIAQLLNGNEDQFVYLKGIHHSDLAQLREKIQSTLQVDQSALWERLAGLAWMHKVVPDFLINKVVKAMGPSICASIVYYVDLSAAVSICLSLDPDLIVDCGPFLDPEHPHIQAIIERFPVSARIELIHKMLQKKMYFTMARYADHLDEEIVSSNMAALQDPADYVHIARYCKDRERVLRLIHRRFNTDEMDIIREAIYAHRTASRELSYILEDLEGTRRSSYTPKSRVSS
eukprot:TRINITY_DN5660_c0_g1_i1.p1 TRINITY_DN5660_c0_g1~~TRINITY_DN5660_c0_g1_i1.p1  ORF type:complete len:293 (-),score=57.05 TRINITY_DN5660_c0_g1_i1:782-1660(-)